MAACGLFIPASDGSEVSVFDDVFCDVGDAQSIEDNLSTFSSHISNIVNIVNTANSKSLVFIDELGGGTDPEEGQAIAKAVVSYLLKCGSRGIVTTHFTALKEYAYSVNGIENASMEFDSETFQPLYNIKLGLPGSSNAIAISRRLGLKEEILSEALSHMNDGAKNFENIVRSAEEIRLKAQREFDETAAMKAEWQEKLDILERERIKIEKEKENLYIKAKIESRRIINEKTAEAEELLSEIEEIFDKEELTQGDLIKARTLKNKLSDKAFSGESEGYIRPQYVNADSVKVGDRVFVPRFNGEADVVNVNDRKKQAEVAIGYIKVWCKISDLMKPAVSDIASPKPGKEKIAAKKTNNVSVTRNLDRNKIPSMEVNLIGMTVSEALIELENFIDSAILANFEEIKIVHGFGSGKLRSAVQEYLRKNKNIAEFRIGKYGEGEGGVTVARLK